MLNFKSIEKSDINEYKKYHDYSIAMSCDDNMLNAYLWRNVYRIKFAVYNETLIKAYFNDDGSMPGYCMPTGKDVAGALEQIMADAKERNIKPEFIILTASQKVLLETLYPSEFQFFDSPENQNYLYLTEDLVKLEGRKFHSKRNHISRFYKAYGDAHFETLDNSNQADALKVARLWNKENSVNSDVYKEYDVIKEALELREEYGMQGAILYVDKKPVAMTLGSEISDKVFDINFEKALREYGGVYAVINHEFAKTLTKYQYINREDDMGIEGLRKAKMSYNPHLILKMFSAKPKEKN